MLWIPTMRLLDAIGRWRARRNTARRLSRLNDHLLRDIGIHRHEIASVVHQSAKSVPVSNDGQGTTIALPNGSLMEA